MRIAVVRGLIYGCVNRQSTGVRTDMNASRHASVHERWAHLRFAVVGHLLAAPPPKGLLRAALAELAARTWQHPVSGEPVRFALSTIERWLLRSRRERRDPVGVLRRKVRADSGTSRVAAAIRQVLQAQYAAHPSWSVQLHYDNLCALAEYDTAFRPVPSYSSIRRLFQAQGWRKRRRLSSRDTAGAQRAEARLAAREVRSYEAAYAGSLWHWDCHVGSRSVLTARGQWATPVLFGALDDYSRLACHLQWYLHENAECVAHGLSQAIHKRGLPRAGLSDNGAAMLAAELTEGLARLGIVHETTLAYSPYMNAKIETFWASVEGRLMAMLEGVVRPDAGPPERSHPGVVRVRLQPNAALRDGSDPVGALPGGGPAGVAPQSRQRRAAAGLHAYRAAHPAPQRRHVGDRGAPLRGPQPLPAPAHCACAIRLLGPQPGPPDR